VHSLPVANPRYRSLTPIDLGGRNVRAKVGRSVLAAAIACALVGTATIAYLWKGKPMGPAPDVAAQTVTTAELGSAAHTRLFFGHMSVGWNVISGLEELYSANGVAPPSVVQVSPEGDVKPVPDDGALVHVEIGLNGDPQGKLANFDSMMRTGLGEQVDVAVLKFCYVDVTKDTDTDALFAEYQRTMDALERDYPNVRFLRTTLPLTVAPSGIKGHLKALLRGDDNPARERYNALVRLTYRADQIFDVAAVESTAPDGTRLSSLYPGYSSDGGHLNAAGSSLVAAELVRLVAPSAGK
jgi:hypothetical protein